VLTGDDGRSSVDVVRAGLAPRFSLAASGRSRTLRQTWLDTFDWRLYQAGFSLEHRIASGLNDYLLTDGHGELLTVSASSVRWPALADALPPGPLRDRLAGLAWVRAILPVARATSTVRQLRVLNDDLKTIALLTFTQLEVPGPDAAPPQARLSVTAIRGYQAQTGRIIRELTETAGLAPATCSALETALAAAGRRPGDYTGKIDVQLTAAMPARRAVTRVLLQLADTLQANVPGTVRDTDTEFLHDLRVAVRRTRSALKLCGDVLTAGTQQRYTGEFKWLGDITTPVRDLDVYLLGYDESAAGLLAATAAELAPFHAHLFHQREIERAWCACCAAAGSPASSRPGAATWPARPLPAVGRPPGSWRPSGSTALTGGWWGPGHGSARAHRRRACTTSASAARNCATCWSSSPPCTTR